MDVKYECPPKADYGAFATTENEDGAQCSELYARCNGKNNGEVKWMRNDLDLVYSYKWAEDSEMIIDVTFKDVEMLALAG